jgi:hypothetical protein
MTCDPSKMCAWKVRFDPSFPGHGAPDPVDASVYSTTRTRLPGDPKSLRVTRDVVFARTRSSHHGAIQLSPIAPKGGRFEFAPELKGSERMPSKRRRPFTLLMNLVFSSPKKMNLKSNGKEVELSDDGHWRSGGLAWKIGTDPGVPTMELKEGERKSTV